MKANNSFNNNMNFSTKCHLLAIEKLYIPHKFFNIESEVGTDNDLKKAIDYTATQAYDNNI